MDRGTYAAASAGFLYLRNLEVISNNIANINTTGFKRQYLGGAEQEFKDTLAAQIVKNDPYAEGDHDRTPGTVNLRTYTDFSPGPIQNTNNPLDVAIGDENTFFVVQGEAGEEYTRAGNFTLNNSGELVTQDGRRVLSDGGGITLPQGKPDISEDGRVSVNGALVGRLQTVKFENTEGLEAVGEVSYRLKPGNPPPTAVDARLLPGSLEMANVSAVSSMVDMIVAQRAFEMYTRTARTVDTMNQTAIQQIGQTR